MTHQDLLKDLIIRAAKIPFGDRAERDGVALRAEMLFRKIVPEEIHYVDKVQAISFYPNFGPTAKDYQQKVWRNACIELSALLETLVEQLDTFGCARATQDPSVRIDLLCDRFHLVSRQLRSRYNNRETITIEDEYDVQDLMHALLRIDFEDIRREEYTPSCAGKASRVDFLLKHEQIVVEIKKTRENLGAAEIGTQLIEDIARYRAHPDCVTLVCFVYDPEGKVGNPRGLERDLSRTEGDFVVQVYIRP
jgi:hypothetical protein